MASLSAYSYSLFDVKDIAAFAPRFNNEADLLGFNVTVPYKQAIVPFLAALSPEAEAIGAVNTVVYTPAGWLGHNTDASGFAKALLAWHPGPLPASALVLGTGGAAKAVVYALARLGVQATCVSRTKNAKCFTYKELTPEMVAAYGLIINATPVGMFPNIEAMPSLPIKAIASNHTVIDLIYNPAETQLLAAAKKQGATTLNGLPMLIAQAEAAGDIWFGRGWQANAC